MTKIQYFNPYDFVDRVIKACNLEDTPTEQKDALGVAIERRLRERLTVTILDNFEKKDLVMLQQLLQDHPELDGVEALSLMALNMPGLQDKLQAAIEELYEELTYDAQRVHEAMAQGGGSQ